MKSIPSRKKLMSVPLSLNWSHEGAFYRVTPWPEVQFERCYGDEWVAVKMTEEAFISAAQALESADWGPYLSFVPGEVSDFLTQFSLMRMQALQVAANCPSLVAELAKTPALTAFVAAHSELRGDSEPSWREIEARFERSGVFGVLEWLGLPASRQTLAVLGNIADPDVPRRFLEPLRTLLWEPQTLVALQQLPAITDRQLARFCHALAA